MDLTEVIGICASVFTASSLLPQLVKVIREKKANDVSLGMLAVLLAGFILWIWYGARKQDWIIMISNSFSLVVNIALWIFSMRYKDR